MGGPCQPVSLSRPVNPGQKPGSKARKGPGAQAKRRSLTGGESSEKSKTENMSTQREKRPMSTTPGTTKTNSVNSHYQYCPNLTCEKDTKSNTQTEHEKNAKRNIKEAAEKKKRKRF